MFGDPIEGRVPAILNAPHETAKLLEILARLELPCAAELVRIRGLRRMSSSSSAGVIRSTRCSQPATAARTRVRAPVWSSAVNAPNASGAPVGQSQRRPAGGDSRRIASVGQPHDPRSQKGGGPEIRGRLRQKPAAARRRPESPARRKTRALCRRTSGRRGARAPPRIRDGSRATGTGCRCRPAWPRAGRRSADRARWRRPTTGQSRRRPASAAAWRGRRRRRSPSGSSPACRQSG